MLVKKRTSKWGYGQGETVDGRTIRRYRGSGRPTGTSYELYRSMSNDARKRYRAMKEAEADAILAENEEIARLIEEADREDKERREAEAAGLDYTVGGSSSSSSRPPPAAPVSTHTEAHEYLMSVFDFSEPRGAVPFVGSASPAPKTSSDVPVVGNL